jgi:hypothetical protein
MYVYFGGGISQHDLAVELIVAAAAVRHLWREILRSAWPRHHEVFLGMSWFVLGGFTS